MDVVKPTDSLRTPRMSLIVLAFTTLLRYGRDNDFTFRTYSALSRERITIFKHSFYFRENNRILYRHTVSSISRNNISILIFSCSFPNVKDIWSFCLETWIVDILDYLLSWLLCIYIQINTGHLELHRYLTASKITFLFGDLDFQWRSG